MRQEKYINKNVAKICTFSTFIHVLQIGLLTTFVDAFCWKLFSGFEFSEIVRFCYLFDVKKSQSLYPSLHACHVHKNITISGCNLTCIYTWANLLLSLIKNSFSFYYFLQCSIHIIFYSPLFTSFSSLLSHLHLKSYAPQLYTLLSFSIFLNPHPTFNLASVAVGISCVGPLGEKQDIPILS